VLVSINDAISLRGSSGTARVIQLIEGALHDLGMMVERLAPRAPGPHKIGNALRSTAWDLREFDRRAAGNVLISPTNVGLALSGRPHLLWVHDTMVLDHPGWFDKAYAAHARLTFGPSVLRATAVCTPSHNARERLVRRWPGIAAKVHVVPWPAHGNPQVPRRVKSAELTVVMLGATEPHKRHTLGIEAVRLLRLVSGEDVRLLVIGPAGRADADVVRRLRLVDPRRQWTRRVTLPDRAAVDAQLRTSWLLLQCSLDEGFCLPLVESAAHAVPAVHTGAGSMAEVHPPGDCRSDQARILGPRVGNP